MAFLDNPVFYIIVLAVILGYFLGQLSRRSSYSDKQHAAQDAINQLSPEGRAKVEQALQYKRKIEAIKWFREDTNLGLKEAKDGVEKMIRDQRSA